MTFLIKMYDVNGHLVHKYSTGIKSRFGAKLSFALKAKRHISRYYLKIIYKAGWENVGNYFSITQLLNAYNAFTEPDLIRYIERR